MKELENDDSAWYFVPGQTGGRASTIMYRLTKTLTKYGRNTCTSRAFLKVTLYYSLQERLDFSCAMFGPDGGLVANAPHIPVHLGSMQETVQYQVE